jgi:outer membrane immunogenic protein
MGCQNPYGICGNDFRGEVGVRKVSLAALIFAVLTGPAMAADMAVKARPAAIVPIAYNWTGLYVGIEGGWSRINTRWLNTATNIGTPDFDGKGALFGGTIGYNWQPVGTSFVLGVEGDWSWANPKAFTVGPGFGCSGTPAGCNTEVTSIGTARARLGFALGPVLLYGTGGAAFISTKSWEEALFTDHQTKVGAVYGGGIEWAFMSQWSLKGEYLHAHLGQSDTIFVTGGGSPLVFTKLDMDIVRFGLNYRF